MVTVVVCGFLYNRLKIAKHTEEVEQQIVEYSQQIRETQADATVYYKRGLAYRTLKRYREAVADFTKVIECEPENALAYKYRGLTHAFLGNHEQCYQDYMKSIELDEKTAHRPTSQVSASDSLSPAIVDSFPRSSDSY